MTERVIIREAEVVDDPADLGVLNDEERERAARRRRPVPFVSAHALARRFLGDVVGADPAALVFERRCPTCGADAHGKPSLVGAGTWQFSLSYTDGLVVIAATERREIGVDVEQLDDADFDDFDRVTVAEDERAELAAQHGPALLAARAQVWARKEAILKATGHGLVVDPTEVVVTGPSLPPRLIEWRAESDPPGPVVLADLPLRSPTHRGAVAVLGEGAIEVLPG